MPHKRNSPNPPSIYRECSGDTYNDWYECCLDKCATPQKWCQQYCETVDNSDECKRACKLNDEICRYSCDAIWPFRDIDNPYKKCAYRCFSNGFKQSCMTENELEIRECCMDNCDSNIPNFDCERFCKNDQLVIYK